VNHGISGSATKPARSRIAITCSSVPRTIVRKAPSPARAKNHATTASPPSTAEGSTQTSNQSSDSAQAHATTSLSRRTNAAGPWPRSSGRPYAKLHAS
jgi:hypothetical protein